MTGSGPSQVNVLAGLRPQHGRSETPDTVVGVGSPAKGREGQCLHRAGGHGGGEEEGLATVLSWINSPLMSTFSTQVFTCRG